MRKKKIYEPNLIYSILRVYTNFIFKRWFNNIEINGLHFIPEGAPVIFAPNHQNALMDAMALLQAAPKPVVFLARADLFKRKLTARLLNIIRIMPAYRKRDGIQNLKKNEESFNISVETLLNKSFLCLMPEGGQLEKRTLRPLVKGIFRIAFSAQEKLPQGEYVRIVPVGLDYGNYDHTGHHLIINFGKPISLKNYVDMHKENAPIALNKIKAELYKRISPLMLDIQSEQHYDATYVSAYLNNAEALTKLNLEDNETNRLAARKYITSKFAQAEEKEDSALMKLDNLCKKWKEKYGEEVPFIARVLEQGHKADAGLLFHIFYIIIAALPALYGLIVNLLPFAMVKGMTTRTKGSGFEATFVYGTAGVFFPFYYLIVAIVSAFSAPTILFWCCFVLSLPFSFFFLLRYRWRLKYVFQRIRNIFHEDPTEQEIKQITTDLMNKEYVL